MDKPQVKAGPIRNGGKASVIKDLRRNMNQKSGGAVVVAAREKQNEIM